MSINAMVLPFAVAAISAIAFRYAKPLKGQTRAFIWFSSLSGAAVGVFGGLLIGGAQMADDPWWQYLGCPLIAFTVTVRMQALAIGWLDSKEGD